MKLYRLVSTPAIYQKQEASTFKTIRKELEMVKIFKGRIMREKDLVRPLSSQMRQRRLASFPKMYEKQEAINFKAIRK